MATTQSRADILIIGLGDLAYLDTDAAASRLQGAFLTTNSMQNLKDCFPGNENPDSFNFDGINRMADVELLGNSSMAYVMSKIDDAWGFKNVCNKSVATSYHDTLIDSLMSSLFAEHINHHITGKGLDSLGNLRADKAFVDEFKAKVTSDMFDPVSERHDLHYAMSLLFVYEYFKQGPNLRLNSDLENLSSLPIIEKWKVKLEYTHSDAKQTLARYAYMTTGVLSLNGRASDTVQDTVLGLSKSLAHLPTGSGLKTSGIRMLLQTTTSNLPPVAGLEDNPTIFDNGVIEEYQSVSRRIWKKWTEILDDQTPTTFWQSGIRSALQKINSTDSVVPVTGSMPYSIEINVHGPELASWCAAHKDQAYMNVDARLKNINQESPFNSKASCFVAGTSILTPQGNVPIESLQEGDQVCTRLEPKQWGVRSCEVVKSVAPKLIYGFNGDSSFFTAGHVFHTTTGIRALQPDIARGENPWIEVGQLAVGDQLLQKGDGDSYTTVEIRSINSELSSVGKHEFVYGVHLREGLRSYHANGYLVALNYPEITVSMIAKRLMLLKPAERLAILKNIRDLQPIFERFGDATALEVLSRESHTNDLFFGGKVSPARPFLTRDLDMPYTMSFCDKSGYGPQLELLHGVLYMDGKFCDRATFEGGSVLWSRQISDGTWEHGHCDFSQNGQRATGHLVNTDDTKDESEKVVLSKAKAFCLTPGTLQKTKNPLSALRKDSAHTPSQFLKMQTPAMMAMEMPEPVMSPSIRQPITFSLAYDPSTYNPENKTPETSTKCGTILLPVEENRYAFGNLKIGEYDQVRDKILERTKTENSGMASLELRSFYKHRVRYDASQREHHQFELINAEALIEASDEFVPWKEANKDHSLDMEPPLKNLHYTNLGLSHDFVIMEVFQTLDFVKSLPNMQNTVTLSGLARSYSSTSEGNQGPAHYIVGTYIKPTMKTVSTASLHALSVAKSSSRSLMSAHSEPLVFARMLDKAGDDDKETLLEELGNIPLDLKTVNANAQTVMNNVMQWHMKAEDRKLFFNATDRPTGLPPHLTTSIANTEEGNWIRDTYASAYICQILTQSDAQVRSGYRFTAQEKKNVQNFWNGKGPNCLARSDVYKKLERAISRYQLRKDYDVIGRIYNAGNGVEYSDALYDIWTGDLQIDSLANVDATSGTSLLSKICTIMDALDDGAEKVRQVDVVVESHKTITQANSNHLVLAATSAQKGGLWMRQYWGLPSDDARDQMLKAAWMEDTLKELVAQLLNQDPSATGPITRALSASLAEFAKTNDGWDHMSDAQKAGAIALDLSDRLKDMGVALAKVLKGLKIGGKWVWEKIRTIPAFGNNSRSVAEAVERVMEDKPTSLAKGPLYRGFMFIVGMSMVGMSIWQFDDKWNDADASDKGRMVMTILSGLNQLADFGIDFVFAIMRYSDRSAISHVAEIAMFAKLDEYVEKRIGSKWAGLLEKQSAGKLEAKTLVMRDVKIIGDGAGTEFSKLNRSVQNTMEGANLNKEFVVEEMMPDLNRAMKLRKAFNIARGVLEGIGYIISIGVAIFMTWDLVHTWDSMNVGTKVFQTLQVAFQCIEATAASVAAGGYIAWGIASSLGAASSTSIGAFAVAAASIFAAVAVVVAVISVVLLIAFFIWSSKQELPASDLETWMQDRAKPWADARPAPIDPLQASIAPSSYAYSSFVQTVDVDFTNTTGTEQRISSIILKFSSGAGGGALFTDKLEYQVVDAEADTLAGSVKLGGDSQGCEMSIVNLKNTVVEAHVDTTITVSKGRNFDDTTPGRPDFTVPNNGKITITMFGVVCNDSGDPCSLSWSVFTDEDMINGQLDVTRGKKP